MTNLEFKELEEQYIELFHVRPWILNFFDIKINEKNEILKASIKSKKEIDVDELRKNYNEIKSS